MASKWEVLEAKKKGMEARNLKDKKSELRTLKLFGLIPLSDSLPILYKLNWQDKMGLL